jgi:hypothetical protein
MLSGSCREERKYLFLMLIETFSSNSYADTVLTELYRLLAVDGDLILLLFVSNNLSYLFEDY